MCARMACVAIRGLGSGLILVGELENVFFHSTFPQGYAVIPALLVRPDTGDLSPDAALNYGAPQFCVFLLQR